MKKQHLYILMIALMISIGSFHKVYALTGGPIAPEIATFATVNLNSGTYVDLTSGDFSYNLPVINLPGRGGLDFTFNLQYKAGIKLNQEASWTGLGWNLSPGAIFRKVNHIPDDYFDGGVHTFQENSGSSYTVSGFGLSYGESKSAGGANGNHFGFNSGSMAPTIGLDMEWWWGEDTDDWNVYGFLHFDGSASKGCNDSRGNGECVESQFKREYNYLGYNPGARQVLGATPPMDTYYVTGPGPSGSMIPWRPRYSLDPKNDNAIDADHERIDFRLQFFFKNYIGKQGGSSESGSGTIKIDHHIKKGDPYDELLDSFTVTDKDGTRYIYGQAAYIHESGSQGCYSVEGEECTDGTQQSKRTLTSPYPYAWYLTAILAPDYVNANENTYSNNSGVAAHLPYPDDGDKGNWIRFDYTKITDDYRYSDPYINWRETPWIMPNSKNTRSWGVKDLVYLRNAVSPTHEAIFNIEPSKSGVESNANDTVAGTQECSDIPSWFPPPRVPNTTCERTYYLDSIDLYKKVPERTYVRGINLKYDYSLRPDTPNSVAENGGTLTLTEVELLDSEKNHNQTYGFNYGRPNSPKISAPLNPAWEINDWDRWGYYKEYGDWGKHEETVKFTDLRKDAAAWSLTDINLPLGGKIRVNYGLDSYYDKFTGEYEWGGGLVVKALVFDDDLGNQTSRLFNYSNDDKSMWDNAPDLEETSGVVGNTTPPPYGTVDVRPLKISAHPYANNSVHYKKVTEYPGSGGYIINEFTSGASGDYSTTETPPNASQEAYWMYKSVATCPKDGAGYYSCWLYDRSYAWNKLKKKRIYNSSSEMISEENYTFEENPGKQHLAFTNKLMDTSVGSTYNYNMHFLLWGNLIVSEKRTMLDGIETTTTYEYDDDTNLPTLITQKSATGCIQTQKMYAYKTGFIPPPEINQKMLEKNMLSQINYTGIRHASDCSDDSSTIWNSKSRNYTYYKILSDGRIYPFTEHIIHNKSPGNYIGHITLGEILERDNYGNVTIEKDANEIEYKYAYDDSFAGSVMTKLTVGSNTGSPQITDFKYDDPRFLKPTGISSPDGTSTTYEYDAMGRLKVSVSPSQARTEYTYNIALNEPNFDVYEHIYTLYSVKINNWIETKTDIEYPGPNNETLSQTRFSKQFVDGLGRKVMDSVYSPSGGRINTITNYGWMGRVARKSYPFESSNVDPEYLKVHLLGTVDFSSTSYHSDPLSRVLYLKPNLRSASSIKTKYSYGSDIGTFNITKSIDPMGYETQTFQDPLSFETKVKRSSPDNNTTLTTISTSVIEPQLRSRVTDAEGKTTITYFDTLGRTIAKLRPDMDAFNSIYHSSVGQVTEEWEYDDAGKLIHFRDSNLAHDPNSKRIHYSYDALGRLIEKGIFAYVGYGDDPIGGQPETISETSYDNYSASFCEAPIGTSTATPSRNDSLMSNYLERANGKVTCNKEPGSLRTILFYDNNGNLGEKVMSLGEGNVSRFKYYYNQAGELVEKTIDPVNNIRAKFIHNNLGQVESVYLLKEGTTPTQVAHILYEVDGKIKTLTRNVNGITTNYGYDKLRRLNLIDNEGLADLSSGFDRFFKFDPLSRITSIYKGKDDTGINIGDFADSYDSFGRLLGGTITSPTNDDVKSLNFAYDNVGNRTYKSVNTFISDTYKYYNSTSGGFERNTNRLWKVTHTDNSFDEYSYDFNGNIIQKTENPSLETTSYDYDLWGNLERLVLGDGKAETYLYNSANQRVKKIDALERITTYVNEGTGVVFDRQEGLKSGDLTLDGKITIGDISLLIAHLFIDGTEPDPKEAGDVTGDGKVTIGDVAVIIDHLFINNTPITRTYSIDNTYLNVGGIRLLTFSQGSFEKAKYFLTDQLGSSSAVIDSEGKEVGRQEYYPFGKTFAKSGNTTRYQFTGKENNETTGLYYYGARYYNPDLGRFMARDTVDDGPSPYVYVSNNPLIAKDPTGHMEEGNNSGSGSFLNNYRNDFNTFFSSIGESIGESIDFDGFVNWAGTTANKAYDAITPWTLGSIPYAKPIIDSHLGKSPTALDWSLETTWALGPMANGIKKVGSPMLKALSRVSINTEMRMANGVRNTCVPSALTNSWNLLKEGMEPTMTILAETNPLTGGIRNAHVVAGTTIGETAHYLDKGNVTTSLNSIARGAFGEKPFKAIEMGLDKFQNGVVNGDFKALDWGPWQ